MDLVWAPRRGRSATPVSAQPFWSPGHDRTPALTLSATCLEVLAAGLQRLGEGDIESAGARLSV